MRKGLVIKYLETTIENNSAVKWLLHLRILKLRK